MISLCKYVFKNVGTVCDELKQDFFFIPVSLCLIHHGVFIIFKACDFLHLALVNRFRIIKNAVGLDLMLHDSVKSRNPFIYVICKII